MCIKICLRCPMKIYNATVWIYIYIYSVTAEFNIFTSILFVAIMLLAIYIPPEIKIFHHLSSLSPGNGSSTRRREFSYNDHELFETVTPFFFSADFCPGNLIISSPSLISCLLIVSTRFLVFVEVPKPSWSNNSSTTFFLNK